MKTGGQLVAISLVLVMVALAGTCCIDRLRAPVIQVKVEVGLDENGVATITGMNVTPEVVNALRAPKASSTVPFPCVSAFAIHNFREIGYWGAVAYTGPGSYELTLAFPPQVEINEGDMILIEARITDESGKVVDREIRRIEWKV